MNVTAEINQTLKEVAADLDRIGPKVQKIDVIEESVTDIQQRLARGGGGGGGGGEDRGGPSIGEQFVQAKAGDIARIAREKGRVSFGVEAALTSDTGSAGDFIVPDRAQPFIQIPRRRLTVRDLLTVTRVDVGAVEIVRQTARTNNAAAVAEGEPKPQSELEFDVVPVPLRVLAHHMKASKQVLEDVPQLRQIIDSELLYGLATVEEQEVLFGGGTGQNLNGMVTQAAEFAAPFDPPGTETMIDTIGLAINQVALTEIPPDGVIVHPSDWWRMRLLKNDDGEYILGDPLAQVQPTLFGLPVVVTQAMEVDKFLVGAFKAQVLFDRWEARVEVGFVNDDFTRNLVTLRAEERVGLAVRHPESLVFGDFGNVA